MSKVNNNMKNKYSISYAKHGQYTLHLFDTVKELKKILSDLNGRQVKTMPCEFMPKNMFMLCLEHNEKALSDFA